MTLRIIARCVHGLEWLCADEFSVAVPGAGGLALDRREITFAVPAVTRELLRVRTADDVFAEAGRCGGAGTTQQAPDVIAAGLARLHWPGLVDQVRRVRQIPAAPLIDVVASLEGRRNYNRFAVEQALGQVLAPVLGGRYLRRTAEGREPGDPDLTVRVFVREDQAIAALRIAALPAHRRAYKLDTAPGTLHPPVAAALARLAAPDDGEPVLDPFCGDGTIAIETALAFPGAVVAGSDADPGRILHAQRNAGRAGVQVAWSQADAGAMTGAPLRDAAAGGVVLTNPPWNLTVDATGVLTGSLDAFWQQVPLILGAGGRLVVITDAALDVPKTLRSQGFGIGLATGLRLAGRICHLVLASPPGSPVAAVPDGAARWREQAVRSGVLTSSGF